MKDEALQNRLNILHEHGVHFWLDGRKLKYQAKPGQLSLDNLAWIKQHFRAIALYCLERELSHIRYMYAHCVDFERKPFPRQLSPACIAAGYRALREMEGKMAALGGEIRRLKASAELSGGVRESQSMAAP